MTEFKDLTDDDIRDIEYLVQDGIMPEGLVRLYVAGEDTRELVREDVWETLDTWIDPEFQRRPLRLKAFARIVEMYADQVEEAIIEWEKNRD